MAESTWLFVYPEGLGQLVTWIGYRYGRQNEIYVFENGVSVPGENSMNLTEALQDDYRVNYYKTYI